MYKFFPNSTEDEETGRWTENAETPNYEERRDEFNRKFEEHMKREQRVCYRELLVGATLLLLLTTLILSIFI